MTQCVHSVPLPSWFPMAASYGIFGLCCIIIFICYAIQVQRLQRENAEAQEEMDAEEHEREEAELLGLHTDGEVKVILVSDARGSSSVNIYKKSLNAQNSSPTAPVSSLSSLLECGFDFKINFDHDNHAIKLIDATRNKLLASATSAIEKNNVEKKLLPSDQTRISRYVIQGMREKLEALTGKRYMFYGYIKENKNWIADGGDNLMEGYPGLKKMVDLSFQKPFEFIVQGYMLKEPVATTSSSSSASSSSSSHRKRK